MIRETTRFFDADKIAASGQCFRWHREGAHAYSVPAWGRVLRLRQPSPDWLEADCSPEEWRTLWRPYLDLDTDYAAYAAQIDPEDAYLLAALGAAAGVRILRQPLWETVASFIISQNNNIPRIQKSLLALSGGPEAAFPQPEAVAAMTDEGLRAAGLGYRVPYLRYAALRYMRDGLEDGASLGGYGEARQYWMSYSGIGPKVADCICLYGLGYKDAFPMDTWVRRIVRLHYNGVFPLGKYEGFAGVLQQWMFCYERGMTES